MTFGKEDILSCYTYLDTGHKRQNETFSITWYFTELFLTTSSGNEIENAPGGCAQRKAPSILRKLKCSYWLNQTIKLKSDNCFVSLKRQLALKQTIFSIVR